MVAEDETLEVASVGGRAPRVLSRHNLCRDIIQPRIEEILSFVKAEIVRLGCEDMLASGAVLTGGTTQLPGMTELGEEILGIPVRRGVPKGVGGLAEVGSQRDVLDGGRPGAVRRQPPERHPRHRRAREARPLLAPPPHALDRVLIASAGCASRASRSDVAACARTVQAFRSAATDGETAREKQAKN